jgi:hypothetical protein
MPNSQPMLHSTIGAENPHQIRGSHKLQVEGKRVHRKTLLKKGTTFKNTHRTFPLNSSVGEQSPV